MPSPITPAVRDCAERHRFGGYRRSFWRSATVTLLQGVVPLLVGAALTATWLTGNLSEAQWWLAVIGGLCLLFGLARSWQALQARRSPTHLFQAGLVAGRPTRPEAFALDDVDLIRETRQQALVQVAYTVRRRSDGRLLRLENVLHVEKLVEAILAGPDWAPVNPDEAAADAAARRADEADERAGLGRMRALAILLLPVAAVLAAAGGYFLLAVGNAPTCNGELMAPTDRCALIDDNPTSPASFGFAEMQRRQDGRNTAYGLASFGLAALCAGPAAVVFWPGRRDRPRTAV